MNRQTLLSTCVQWLIWTPFYPYWLDIRNEERGNDELFRLFWGKVLETGAGNGVKKERALKINPRIAKYVATDYSDWDELFAEQKQKIQKHGAVTELLYGRAKNDSALDVVCDAMDLPFPERSFHVYCSYEVLEHISDPMRFFQEANRVLKRGGICVTTMPFLYREHGGEQWDFQRFARGGYAELASKNGFALERVFSYCCFGTTLASLTNQYLIRKFSEGSWLLKLVLLPFLPGLFFCMNTLGFVLDSVDQDIRFAERFHVVMRKKHSLTS